MFDKKIFIDYKENGALTDAYSVTLESSDASFGIKEYSGSIIASAGTAVDNPSTGRYEYTVSIDDNTVYIASWKVQAVPAGPFKYAVQQFGPYGDDIEHSSSTESRGLFVQYSTGSILLRVFDIEGVNIDAEDISVTIEDNMGNTASSGLPEKLSTGLYVYDWVIPNNQTPGQYLATWTYTVDSLTSTQTQDIVIAPNTDVVGTSVYAARISDLRTALTLKLMQAQKIPVYRDIAKPTRDYQTYYFAFSKWNGCAGVRIYVNNVLRTGGYATDFAKGKITFDTALTSFDTVTADYNFRWFADEELDRFLSDALGMLNLYPGVTAYNMFQVPDRFLVLLFYGAAVEALRSMLLSLQFQEAQLVFGGPDGAKTAFSQLEALKKNYEETWMEGLKQKKYGPYRGLTKMIVVPEYTLPGGKSRWFRMLFSDAGF